MYHDRISNLEDMTPKEWKLWGCYESIFSGLLDDLKRNNLLKHPSTMPKNFIKLIETTNKFAITYNMVQFIFDEKGRSKRFVDQNKDEFKITEEGLVYLLVSQVITCLITNAELFRNAMLLILTMGDKFNERMGLGTLLRELIKVSPKHGTDIKNEIDTDLRNAMVHGTFWVDGLNIHYCTDMTLTNPKIIRLDKLIFEEVKCFNIIARCFIWLIGEKASKGFFV